MNTTKSQIIINQDDTPESIVENLKAVGAEVLSMQGNTITILSAPNLVGPLRTIKGIANIQILEDAAVTNVPGAQPNFANPNPHPINMPPNPPTQQNLI